MPKSESAPRLLRVRDVLLDRAGIQRVRRHHELGNATVEGSVVAPASLNRPLAQVLRAAHIGKPPQNRAIGTETSP
jgi:hypothetical protein